MSKDLFYSRILSFPPPETDFLSKEDKLAVIRFIEAQDCLVVIPDSKDIEPSGY